MTRALALVVAADEAGGIGKDGDLPFRLPGDMAFFKRLTSTAAPGKQNAVVMGRKTYLSIPARFRPLPGRINLVLSRSPERVPEGALHAASLDEGLAALEAIDTLDQVFVIGGGEIYALALADARLERVHLTRIHARLDCDTFLPPLPADLRLVTQDGPHDDAGVRYTFETYER